MLRFVVLFGFQLLSRSLHYVLEGNSICGGTVKVKTVFGVHTHDWSVKRGELWRLMSQQNNCYRVFFFKTTSCVSALLKRFGLVYV